MKFYLNLDQKPSELFILAFAFANWFSTILYLPCLPSFTSSLTLKVLTSMKPYYHNLIHLHFALIQGKSQ